MSAEAAEGFAWGDAHFVGDWTMLEMVQFVRRVKEIREQELAKQPEAVRDE